jgi:hypothetical protein
MIEIKTISSPGLELEAAVDISFHETKPYYHNPLGGVIYMKKELITATQQYSC